jgi:CRP/FNR family transcriptional regulator, cyclic AMP receptor protein
MSMQSGGHTSAPARDKRSVLRAHPFFKDVSDSVIDMLAMRAVTRHVKKGTLLFRKGDAGPRLYAVCSGTVRISAPSEEGKDTIFRLIPAGEIFGEIAFLDGGERTADAVTVEDSELMMIERRDFLPLLERSPELATRLIEILCQRLRRTSEQVEDVVFLGLPDRLAKALLQLSQSAATPTGRGRIRITQREISQMIGVSRESANKQLREWQRRKWLRLERGGVIILAPESLDAIVSKSED